MAYGRADAEDECVSDLERYLPLMKATVARLMDIYFQRGLENYGSALFGCA